MEYISKQEVLDKLNDVSANFLEMQIKNKNTETDKVISPDNVWYLLSLFEKYIENLSSIEINITEENQIHMAPLIKNQNNIRF